jgi:hypothetical protein
MRGPTSAATSSLLCPEFSGAMKQLIGAIIVLAAAVGFSLWFAGPEIRTITCDGAFPAWMLEARNYDGSGCVEGLPLPSEQAPADADWRIYCTGFCVGPNPSGVSFPREDVQ